MQPYTMQQFAHYMNSPGFFLMFYGILMLISLAIGVFSYIFQAICMMKLFAKAYEEPWKAWVPFYNSYILNELVFGNGWLFLLTFVTFIPYIGSMVYLVYYYYLQWKMTEVYGEGLLVFFGLIFLRIVFLPYLAFGHSEYHEEKVDFLNGLIAH